MVKNLHLIQETRVWSLGQEDLLEKGMATQSSILAWEIHGQGTLAGYGRQGCKESNTTERLTLFRVESVVIFFFSHVLASMRSEMWSDVLLAVRHGLWIFLRHLSESYYTAVHALYPQPASCCRVCCLSWPAFLTLELQAVHPSVNPCINFHDSDVSNSAPSGVFDTGPMWLIASQQQPDLPSVCPILGTDTTVHPAAVSQHLRDMMFFLFLLCDI